MMSTTSTTPIPSPTTTGAPDVTIEENYSSWSLFIVCMLLIMSLWMSYYLQIKRIRVVHETIISIFAGMAVGLVVRLAPGELIREMLTFKHTLFFNLLLPPIILNSGYELKQENFFRNFGSILTFAFLGTFISAVGLGVLVYIWSFLGLESLKLSLLECLIFGSTLSATDPVTILAIFNQYKVDPKLYSVIFGESILNDAVSIVMYATLSQFHGEEIFVSSIFRGIGIFLLSFSISMALGVFFGLIVSLTLKHSHLSFYPSIESCLVALTAYTSYFFSNGLQMSGIVSLLFCGITLKHYAYHTMSRRTQRTTKYIFSILAQISENFIFIYLGLSIFTTPPRENNLMTYIKPLFIGVTFVSVIFTRYAAVFPLSEAINFFHRHVRGQRHDELPHSYQMMLFWAGLRGAVGVALAAGFQGENAHTLRTTVLIVVIATVILFGGTTSRMLEVLGVRTGVEDGEMSESEAGGEAVAERAFFGRPPLPSRRFSRSLRELGTQQTYGYTDDPPYTAPAGPIFSAPSSSASDSDIGEVLPMSSPVHTRANSQLQLSSFPPHPQQHGQGHEHEHEHGQEHTADSKWFQALDERYLLPLFSNATASRTFHARRRRGEMEEEDLEEGDDLGAGAGVERRLGEGYGYGHGHGHERRWESHATEGSNPQGQGTGTGPTRNFSETLGELFEHMRWGRGDRDRERDRELAEAQPLNDHERRTEASMPRQQPERASSLSMARGLASPSLRGLGSPGVRGGGMGGRGSSESARG